MNAIAHIKLEDGQAFSVPVKVVENKYSHAVMLLGISLDTLPKPKEVLIKVIEDHDR